ncbi:MAG: LysR family transcriptional regulator [Burkholderiales bacterium]|nr:LysR family transcriptional regulator [Burkholderiales bacterium]
MAKQSRDGRLEAVTQWPLMTRIKLRQLALVVALVQRRSLRQAASDIAITQPAATKLLQELESALGVPLFTRHAWGMAPTLYGEALVRRASGVLTDLGEAREELAGIAAGASGSLRVGGVTGAMPDLLAPAIRRMQERHPRIKLFVLINTSEVLLAALRQGTLDVAVCPLPADTGMSDLEAAPLGDEPLRIVARAGHPLARRRSLALSALANATWLVQTPDTPLRRDLESILAGAGLRLPAATIETVSIVATLALLQDSDAVTVMPSALARHYARFRIVAELPVNLSMHTSRYEIVTRARRELSPAARAFVAMLPGSARG